MCDHAVGQGVWLQAMFSAAVFPAWFMVHDYYGGVG